MADKPDSVDEVAETTDVEQPVSPAPEVQDEPVGTPPEQIMPDADAEALRAELRRARDDAARYRRQAREAKPSEDSTDLQSQLDALRGELEAERRKAALATVAADFQLTPAQAKHLTGADEAALRESAEALITAFGVQAMTQPAATGARPDLRGGLEPHEAGAPSPEDIVRAVYARRSL